MLVTSYLSPFSVVMEVEHTPQAQPDLGIVCAARSLIRYQYMLACSSMSPFNPQNQDIQRPVHTSRDVAACIPTLSQAGIEQRTTTVPFIIIGLATWNVDVKLI